MIYSHLSEEKTTQKNIPANENTEINKRKNKKYKHSLSKFLFFGDVIDFLTQGQSNHRKTEKSAVTWTKTRHQTQTNQTKDTLPHDKGEIETYTLHANGAKIRSLRQNTVNKDEHTQTHRQTHRHRTLSYKGPGPGLGVLEFSANRPCIL